MFFCDLPSERPWDGFQNVKGTPKVPIWYKITEKAEILTRWHEISPVRKKVVQNSNK
jgi:hypothetical protein